MSFTISYDLNQIIFQVKKLISATIENRPKRRNGFNQKMSDYILFLITESLATLVETTPKSAAENVGLGGLPISALPEAAASSTLLALTRCVEVSYNELCRQLAFRGAGDFTSFDVIRLAYSLLTYVKASKAMAGTAGREVIRGDGPEPGTAIGSPNQRLVRAALAAFFAEQNANGLWVRHVAVFSFSKSCCWPLYQIITPYSP